MTYTDTYNAPEKPVYAMVGIFRNDQKIMLVEKPAKCDESALQWTLPGGWINGKDQECMIAGRHAIDQTGIMISIFPNARTVETEKRTLRGYVARQTNEKEPVTDDTHIWVHYSDIPKMGLNVDPDARRILDAVKNDLFAAFLSRPSWQQNNQPRPDNR